MDLEYLFNVVKENIPVPVIIAVVSVIMLVDVTTTVIMLIEDAVEEKKGKQIKFFDHKKIWLSVFWCGIATCALAAASYIEWKQFAYWWLVILGASTFMYEAVLKRFGMKKEDEN